MQLSYLAVFLVALLINLYTLYLVAKGTKEGSKILFKNPAFVLGDFVLLPLYFVLVSIFLSNNINFVKELSFIIYLLVGFLSLTITIISGRKFSLLKAIWIPHGIFHWLTGFSFLLIVLVSATNGWIDGLLVSGLFILLLVNQLLGFLYPKRLA